MKVLAAYMLAVLGGNQHPDAAAIQKILDSVAIKADKAQVDKVVSALAGKDIETVINEGKSKLSALPAAGAGAPAASSASAAAPAAGGKAEAAKKEEPKKKEEPEEEVDMGFSLFD